jgi:hypothetical protein
VLEQVKKNGGNMAMRKILIFVLVLMLAASLFACVKQTPAKKQPPAVVTEKIEADEFWDELFSAFSGVGKTAVDPSKDLMISLAIDASIDFGEVSESVKLSADLIIDRTSIGERAGEKTAIKLSGELSKTPFTLAYFMAEPKKLYLEYNGKKQYLGIDLGINDTFANAVDGILNSYDFGLGFPVMGLIDELIYTFGDNFNVNSAAAVLLDLLDIESLLSGMEADPMLMTMLNGILENGKTDFAGTIKGFSGFILDGEAVFKTSDDKSFKAAVSPVLVSLLGGVLGGSPLFESGNTFEISFTKKTAEAGAPLDAINIDGTLLGYGKDEDKNISLHLGLSGLSIKNADGSKAKELLGVSDDYQSFSAKGTFRLHLPQGFLKLTLPAGSVSGHEVNQVDLAATYLIEADVRLNLDDLTKTALDLKITGGQTDVLTAVYFDNEGGNGTLRLKLNKDEPMAWYLAYLVEKHILDNQDASVKAAFKEKYELEVTGIDLQSALPVWTGGGAEALRPGEVIGALDFLLSLIMPEGETPAIFSPDLLFGKGFLSFFADNLSTYETSTGSSGFTGRKIEFTTLYLGLEQLFRSERWSTRTELASLIFNAPADWGGKTTAQKVAEINTLFAGSAFVGAGVQTIENILSGNVVIARISDDPDYDFVSSIYYTLAEKTLNLSSLINFGAAEPSGELTLSDDSPSITASVPLIEWGDFWHELFGS